MKNQTIILGTIAVAILLACKRKQAPSESYIPRGTIPLELIRLGIKELWYKAELKMPNETEYYVILHSLLVDGNEFVQQYPITQATFDALKADGVPVI